MPKKRHHTSHKKHHGRYSEHHMEHGHDGAGEMRSEMMHRGRYAHDAFIVDDMSKQSNLPDQIMVRHLKGYGEHSPMNQNLPAPYDGVQRQINETMGEMHKVFKPYK